MKTQIGKIYFQYHLTHILHGEEEKGCQEKGSSKEKDSEEGRKEKEEIVFLCEKGTPYGVFFLSRERPRIH
jgi:hypothetical protein